MRIGILKRGARRRSARIAWSLLAAALLGTTSSPADAREVGFSITVDERFLTHELQRSAYVDPDGTARVFNDDSGCNSLVLFDPSVTAEAGRLVVRTAGEGHLGVSLGGRCLLPLSWHGIVELIEEPSIDPDAPLVRFVVVDSKLLDADGSEPLASGLLWGWVKQYVHPRLETRIDLQGPVDELRSILPTFTAAGPNVVLEASLASLTLSDVEVEPGAVRVRVRMQAPDLPEPRLTAEEAVPPLSEEELLRWQTALQQWDAFLTFIVKITGRDTPLAELRSALLGILLDERYALIEALASPDARVRDPVRPLFLRTWERLAPVLREIGDALPADQGLRYLSFVSAGDALQALDELGPESGIEISADGLRRLARLMAPATLDDPLSYGVEVDPALRELFGFGAPLPPPELPPDDEASGEPEPGTSPAPSSEPAAGPSPETSLETSVEPSPEPSADGGPTSWLWFGGTAWAADEPVPEPDKELVKRLNAWAPTRADVAEYAPLARQLLDTVTTWLLARHDIDPAHAKVFRALVPATAWKESCWRQFVERNGKLATLTSRVGSVGIMQVNVSVWRGFYEVSGLKRDIAYNARAGGEILSRYWTDYAVARREHEKGGGVDALARAAYAAYNGGPGQLSRYRQKGRAKRERAVDVDFFDKYKRMKAGDTLAVVECFTD